MNTTEYYKHCRKLGAFSASECLTLAREAASLDEIAQSKKAAPPDLVGAEYAYGSLVKFSNQIKVF